ncbi:MAG: hypothetical protein K9M10_02240 [Candidatus Pacebacteria bacterium]|nr:hypothetical protein [Candidatus Paceibacterota bacterium]MCF7857280.1 hypothetical protein [Candidatus Paceibacterota bacterium]
MVQRTSRRIGRKLRIQNLGAKSDEDLRRLLEFAERTEIAKKTAEGYRRHLKVVIADIYKILAGRGDELAC